MQGVAALRRFITAELAYGKDNENRSFDRTLMNGGLTFGQSPETSYGKKRCIRPGFS